MNGMGGAQLGIRSTSVTHHFFSVLFVEALVFLGVTLIVVALVAVRRHRRGVGALVPTPEPQARRILRLSFGVFWVLAGLLQLQPDMPLGLPINVVAPAAAGAPGWLQSWITPFTDAWLRHPVVGASAVVFVELGLGVWLLCANRGRWSRVAGAASFGWAVAVWIFGNALGGMFLGPISWMFGAPGAAAFYALAGFLLALGEGTLGNRLVLIRLSRGFGGLLGLLAVLQAWPGRGFWNGGTVAHPGAISAMADSMATLKQPAALAQVQQHLATFALHGSWLINLVVILGLGLAAGGLLWATTSSVGIAARVYLVLALLDWILIQDLGIFGGLATDVNSMLPSLVFPLALWAGMLERDRATTGSEGQHSVIAVRPEREIGVWVGVAALVLGAAPLLGLLLWPGASADAASAAGPGVARVQLRSPEISLIDQTGHPFTLSSLRGRKIILTFLDPTCSSECPIEAQQMRAAGEALGSKSGVEFVVVNCNPQVTSAASMRAFDDQEHLSDWAAWHFLTGTPSQLAGVWKQWGIQVQIGKNGSMVMHTEPFFAIDTDGVVRFTWDATTGEGASSPIARSGTALIVEQARALS